MPDPVTMGLIGATVAGGIYSNWSSARQASKQRKFQERMSSTAHQRQVKDLKLAGLNPILSAGGSGASSPGGAMGKVENPLKDAPTSAIALKQLEQNAPVAAGAAESSVQQAKKTAADTDAVKIANTQAVLANPKILEALQGDINLKSTTSALQAKQNKKVDAEIKILTEELQQMKFKGTLFEWGNELTPKAKIKLNKLESLINRNKDNQAFNFSEGIMGLPKLQKRKLNWKQYKKKHYIKPGKY